MSTQEAEVTKVYVGAPPQPNVRGAFMDVFVPVAMDDDKPDQKKYSITLLLPPNYDLSELKAAAAAAVRAKWGEPGIEQLKQGRIKSPFRKQEEKQHVAGFTEGYYIQCTSKNKPGVVNEDVQPIMDASELVAGMYVIATVNAYCWDHPKNGKGVSFGLLNVMKFGDDGTRYGASAAKPEDDFGKFRKTGAGSGNAGGASASKPADIW